MNVRQLLVPLPITLSTLLLLPACAAEPEPTSDPQVGQAEDELFGGALAKFLRGRDLFFNETFDGNGRTCETCHLRDSLGDGFDLTPADVQAAFAADPNGPLFRSIDSDDGQGSDYSLLLRDATVRIPFVLPPNVSVEETNSPHVQQNSDGTTTVFVRRSTPTIENIALEDQLMWDGRLGSDLEQQAEDAVVTHSEPGRLPTPQEAADLAFYQERFFSNFALRLHAKGAPPPELPAGETASEQRGRTFFVPSGPIDANNRGLCATCHSGPMLNTTHSSNPVQLGGERFTNNFVSESNMLLGNQLEELTYNITLEYDLTPFPGGPVLIPQGTVLTLKSSDPGRLLVTGDPCEVPGACLINPGSTVSLFKIPTLWGTADSAPYFHDNSAADLEELMDVYQFLFAVTADGLQNPAFIITQQDREDIIAYAKHAFRRHASP